MQAHADQGAAMLDAAATRFEARDIRFELDMAYLGQTHTVPVPLDVTLSNGQITPPTPNEVARAFETAYLAAYGRTLPGGVKRVMNLRSAVIGKRPKFDLATLAPQGGSVAAATKGTRQVHFGDSWHETTIYDRLALPVDAIIKGPAILEQADTTVLIDPGLSGRVDSFGNTIITRD